MTTREDLEAIPIPARRFTLDGEPITDLRRLALELDLDEGDIHDISNMRIGEEMVVGGGVFATFTLKRVE